MTRHWLFFSIAVIHGVRRSEADIDPKGLATLASTSPVPRLGSGQPLDIEQCRRHSPMRPAHLDQPVGIPDSIEWRKYELSRNLQSPRKVFYKFTLRQAANTGLHCDPIAQIPIDPN